MKIQIAKNKAERERECKKTQNKSKKKKRNQNCNKIIASVIRAFTIAEYLILDIRTHTHTLTHTDILLHHMAGLECWMLDTESIDV